MTTKSVTIQWEKTSFSKLNEKYEGSDANFYAFSRGKNLLFIGMAFKQQITDEVKQSVKDNHIGTAGLSIWLGHVVETEYKRLTPQIVLDVKRLLIFIHQPRNNTQFMKSYNGRDGLKVKSRRCKLLRPCVRAEAGSVYRTCN